MGHDGHDHSHGDGHGDHGGHSHPHAHGSHAAARPVSPSHEHKAQAPTHVATYVITCSDTLGSKEDQSGALIRDALEQAGHAVTGATVVKDDAGQIRAALETARQSGVRAILINGGTGVGRRDVTIETVRPLLEKELPGFGELFRALSFQEIGSPAMMSRALAGTVGGIVVFCLPGSPNAVRLAMDALILPELGHLVRELSK